MRVGAAFLRLWVPRWQPEQAADVIRLHRWNGGNSSGIAIACIDDHGDVRADPGRYLSDEEIGVTPEAAEDG